MISAMVQERKVLDGLGPFSFGLGVSLVCAVQEDVGTWLDFEGLQ